MIVSDYRGIKLYDLAKYIYESTCKDSFDEYISCINGDINVNEHYESGVYIGANQIIELTESVDQIDDRISDDDEYITEGQLEVDQLIEDIVELYKKIQATSSDTKIKILRDEITDKIEEIDELLNITHEIEKTKQRKSEEKEKEKQKKLANASRFATDKNEEDDSLWKDTKEYAGKVIKHGATHIGGWFGGNEGKVIGKNVGEYLAGKLSDKDDDIDENE